MEPLILKTEPNAAAFDLTKREHIAAEILSGFAACDESETPIARSLDEYARLAVKWADALINALNETKP